MSRINRRMNEGKAINFMMKYGNIAKICDIDKSVIYEILHDISIEERNYKPIRLEFDDSFNMMYYCPGICILIKEFNDRLKAYTKYGLYSRSISINTLTMACDFVEMFEKEIDTIEDEEKRKRFMTTFTLQASDLINYVIDRICLIYSKFEMLASVMGLDKDKDFEELNYLIEKIDDYMIGGIDNPLIDLDIDLSDYFDDGNRFDDYDYDDLED